MEEIPNNEYTLYIKGSVSYILQNGYKSDPVTLGRGCRQGDPVTPYLSVIAAEILSKFIQNNPKITGLDTAGVEQKTSQYADDTTLFIAPEENSLRECMQVLNEFHHISGIQINVENPGWPILVRGETAAQLLAKILICF